MAAEKAALEELQAAEDSQNGHEQRPNGWEVSRLNHFLLILKWEGRNSKTPPHQTMPRSNEILDSADQISLLRSEPSGVWLSSPRPTPIPRLSMFLLTNFSIPPS